jgi:hypothetical protein
LTCSHYVLSCDCLIHEGAVRTVLIAGWDRRPPKELVTKALEAAVAVDTAAAPCPTGITGQGSRRGPPCSAKSSPRPQVRRKPGNPRSQAGLPSDARVATWQSDPRTQSAGCGMPNKASQSSTALRKKSISLVHTPFRRPAPPSLFLSRRMVFRRSANRQTAERCLFLPRLRGRC